MAKKRTRRSAGFSTQKVFKYVRLAALVAPAAQVAMGAGSASQKINTALAQYTGYDIQSGNFDGARLARGWGPYLVSVLATYGIPKVAGILRRL